MQSNCGKCNVLWKFKTKVGNVRSCYHSVWMTVPVRPLQSLHKCVPLIAIHSPPSGWTEHPSFSFLRCPCTLDNFLNPLSSWSYCIATVSFPLLCAGWLSCWDTGSNSQSNLLVPGVTTGSNFWEKQAHSKFCGHRPDQALLIREWSAA